MSPPSRAAWIEMTGLQAHRRQLRRRLHGRRGLKFGYTDTPTDTPASPPSRAAWIEIDTVYFMSADKPVAAFTGGVD